MSSRVLPNVESSRRLTILAAVSALGLAASDAPQPPDALRAAAEALGVGRIETLEFVASGSSFTVGQNFTSHEPWPRVTVESYRALIDYRSASMRVEMVRAMGAIMPRGGGVPFTGELRQIQVVSGDHAWNEPVSAVPPQGAAPATPCTRPEAGGTGWAGPAPESQTLCMLMLWATPQGFIRAAIENGATTTKTKAGTNVSFTLAGKYRVTGLIDPHNQVERVRTWIDQSIVGDMPVETEYSGYEDFGGVPFPSRIVQKQGGFPSLELAVASARANPVAAITVPDRVRNAPNAPAVTVTSQRLADGVFFLAGGTHHSLAIAMKDHIVLVDTPNGEARALAVIAKAKDLIPGKPIRYVVAMHHHWDHLGGIRTAIDEGATIVAHRSNEEFLERAAAAPHTVHPDRLSMSRRPLKLRTVGAAGTLTDGERTIKLYAMTGFAHTADMLLVYLPTEKILAEADAYSPPERAADRVIAPKVPYAAALYDNIRRLGIEVHTIVPFHGGRTVDLAEVAWQGGRAAPNAASAP